jgi:hypothetical protein
MRFRAVVLTTIFLTLSSSVSWSRHPSLLGSGYRSCENWTTEREGKTDRSYQFVQWILGFITAVNVYVLQHDDDVTNGADNKELLEWIDNYCRAHPLVRIEDAAEELLKVVTKRSGAT